MNPTNPLAYYQERRAEVYRLANKEYLSAGFVFRSITKQDVETASRCWPLYWPHHWSWPHNYHRYNTPSHVDRFDLAIDYRKELLVLCYGKPSGNNLALEIDFIQRRDVKIKDIASALSLAEYAAVIYARLLNISELRLTYPLEKAIHYYEHNGYAIGSGSIAENGEVQFMSKSIKQTKG